MMMDRAGVGWLNRLLWHRIRDRGMYGRGCMHERVGDPLALMRASLHWNCARWICRSLSIRMIRIR